MALPYKGPDNNRQDERNIPFGQIREQMWRFISVLLLNWRFHRGGTSIVVSTSRCGCLQSREDPCSIHGYHILFAACCLLCRYPHRILRPTVLFPGRSG